MGCEKEIFLRKLAWDYFAAHASQRMSIFNFYIILSSLTATTYFASFKPDSNLQPARWLLASSLCFFAFIFWKLDGRNKELIKNAEAALRYFEAKERSLNAFVCNGGSDFRIPPRTPGPQQKEYQIDVYYRGLLSKTPLDNTQGTRDYSRSNSVEERRHL